MLFLWGYILYFLNYGVVIYFYVLSFDDIFNSRPEEDLIRLFYEVEFVFLLLLLGKLFSEGYLFVIALAFVEGIDSFFFSGGTHPIININIRL